MFLSTIVVVVTATTRNYHFNLCKQRSIAQKYESHNLFKEAYSAEQVYFSVFLPFNEVYKALLEPPIPKPENRMEVTEIFVISVTVLGYHLSNSLAIRGNEFLETDYNETFLQDCNINLFLKIFS